MMTPVEVDHLDGLFLAAVLEEVGGRVLGGRVDRISQPQPDRVLFTFWTPGQRTRVMLAVTPHGGGIHVTKASWTNPQKPPVFTMVLRKHLLGARLIGWGQQGRDRAAWLAFTRRRGGRISELRLHAEFFGSTPRMVLTSTDGTVIDAMRRIAPADHKRPVWPGLPYTPPPAPSAPWDPYTATPSQLTGLLDGALAEGLPPWRAVVAVVAGAGPVLALETVHRAVPQDVGLGTADGVTASALAQAVLSWALPLRTTGPVAAGLYPQQPGQQHREQPCQKPQLQPLAQPAGQVGPGLAVVELTGHRRVGRQVETFADFSSAADAILSGAAAADNLARLRRPLAQAMAAAQKRAEKLVAARKKDLQRGHQADQWRLYADLLTANLWRWPGTASVGATITVPNLFATDEPPVTIPLRPALNPAQNAQQYYRRYRRAQRTVAQATTQLAKAEQELAYWASLQLHVEQAESDADLLALRAEWEEADRSHRRLGTRALARSRQRGLGRKQRRKAGDRRQTAAAGTSAPDQPRRFRSREGLPIFVGRNNRQNERLTLQRAAPFDLWFHARGIPGAHVVVRLPNNKTVVGEETLADAALLAAYFSQARHSAGVPVDWVAVNKVKKIPGARPGMVRYQGHRTLTVTPDGERVAALQEGAQPEGAQPEF